MSNFESFDWACTCTSFSIGRSLVFWCGDFYKGLSVPSCGIIPCLSIAMSKFVDTPTVQSLASPELLKAPKRKTPGSRLPDYPTKRRLVFEAADEPVKHFLSFGGLLKANLAGCRCFQPRTNCELEQCVCPPAVSFAGSSDEKKKLFPLGCNCPKEPCKPFQAAQEPFSSFQFQV